MPTFVVHTDVRARELGPFGFTTSVPKMLNEAQVKNVTFKIAYACHLAFCHCVRDRKIICEFESLDKETVRDTLAKIGMPVTAILQKEK
jgi:hypothetical protein